MLWFSVWTLLVVGTLIGAFFLGRYVYRSGRLLLSEVGRASELLGELADKTDALAAAAPAHPVRAVALGDHDEARRRWDEAGTARTARRDRRRRRYQATYERWRSFSR